MIFWARIAWCRRFQGGWGLEIFEFYVSDYQNQSRLKKPLIQVQNSQVEIDGGFENENVFTLIEGKTSSTAIF